MRLSEGDDVYPFFVSVLACEAVSLFSFFFFFDLDLGHLEKQNPSTTTIVSLPFRFPLHPPPLVRLSAVKEYRERVFV